MKKENKLQLFIEDDIKETLSVDSEEINSEIIEDIEESLEPLKVVFKLLENEIEQVKKNVKEKIKQRQEKRAEQIDQNSKREEKLKENIEKNTEENVGKGQIKEKDKLIPFVLDGYPESRILKHTSNIRMKKYGYHLAILENSGRLFWVRVSEARITQFRGKLEFPVKINNVKYKVSFFAPLVRKDYFGQVNTLANLTITLAPLDFNYPICEISAWFDLETLEITDIKTLSEESIQIISSNYGSNFSDFLRNIEKWISENQKEFSLEIIKLLLNPKYDKKLESEDVKLFLRPDERCELKLGKIEDKPILIFKNLSY